MMSTSTDQLPRFRVVPDGPDRTLYLEGTATLVGWIERGRAMTDAHTSWTEWRFTPNDQGAPAGPIRDNISDAYSDARRYAAGAPIREPG